MKRSDLPDYERTIRVVGAVFMGLNALLTLFGICTALSRSLLLSLIGIALAITGIVMGMRAWRQPLRPYPNGVFFGMIKPQGLPEDPTIEPGWMALSALCFLLAVCFL